MPARFEPNRGQADPAVLFPGHVGPDLVSLLPGEVLVASPAGASGFRFPGADPAAQVEGESASGATSTYFSAGRSPVQAVPQYGAAVYQGLYPGIDAVFYAAQDGGLEFDARIAAGADAALLRIAPLPGAHLALDAQGGLAVSASLSLQPPVVLQDGRRIDAAYTLAGDGTASLRLAAYDHSRALVVDPKLGFSSYFGGTGFDSFRAVKAYGGSVYATGKTSSAANRCAASAPPASPPGTCPVAYGSTLGNDALVARFDVATDGAMSLKWVAVLQTAEPFAIDVDAGGVYVAGLTTATGFPVSANAYQARATVSVFCNGSGAFFTSFLSRIDLTGQTLLYSTFFGGGGRQAAFGVAAAGNGQAVVVGAVLWAGGDKVPMPTLNGFQMQNNGPPHNLPICPGGYGNIWFDGCTDAFVARFDTGAAGTTTSTGNPASLVYSTFAGSGSTSDTDCAFFDMNVSGTDFPYGIGDDVATDVAVDAAGNAWVTGYTDAVAGSVPAFPLAGASVQKAPAGNDDAFVLEVSPDGGTEAYGTLMGGTGMDRGYSIAVAFGKVYVAGMTDSPDFPTTAGSFHPGPYGGTGELQDAWVAILDPAAGKTVASTYFGSLGETVGAAAVGDEVADAVQVDPDGNVAIEGLTDHGVGGASPLPRLHAWPALGGGRWDLFAATFSPDLKQLLFATPLGSAGDDAETVVNGFNFLCQGPPFATSCNRAIPVNDHGYTVGHHGALLADALGPGIVVAGADAGGFPIAASASNAGVALPALASFHRTYNAGGSDAVLARFVGPSEPYVACGSTTIPPLYRLSSIAFTWAPAGLPHTQGIETYDAMAANDPAFGIDPASLRWDFDYDGATFQPDAAADGQATPSHNYAGTVPAGLHTVLLQARDTDGRLGAGSCTVLIANHPPAAVCSVTDDPPYFTGAPIAFASAGSTDDDGTVQSYAWSFPGATPASSTQADPTASWATPGAHAATLRVTDSDGATSPPATCTLSLQDGLVCTVPAGPFAPGQSIPFLATGGTGQDSWSGGGLPPSALGASFPTSFGAAGTYTVRVQDSASPPAASTCTVVVAPTAATCTGVAPAPAVPGQPVTVSVAGGTPPYTWVSSDGANGQSPGPSFTVTYAAAGTYKVSVTDSSSPSASSDCPDIVVTAWPAPTCSPGLRSADRDAMVLLSASGGDGAYAWSAPGGNPATGSGALFSTSFRAVGTKSVTVASDGRTATCQVDVGLPPCGHPLADFWASSASPRVGDPVAFTDASSIDTGHTLGAWLWDFGDGSVSAESDPVHAFPGPGTYRVRLTVTETAADCAASFEVVLHVAAPVAAADADGAPAAPPSGGSGSVDTPTADAGPDQVVLEGSPVTLEGSSRGTSSAPVSYLWRLAEAPKGAEAGLPMSSSARALAFTAPPAVREPFTVAYELRVVQGSAVSPPAVVRILVLPANLAPVADAGPDAEAARGTVVHLDGSASEDPDGGRLSFAWTQVAGRAVLLQGAETATPSFEVPADFQDGSLEFRLIVSDGRVSSSDSVAVAVLPPAAAAHPGPWAPAHPASGPEPASADGVAWGPITLAGLALAVALVAVTLLGRRKAAGKHFPSHRTARARVAGGDEDA